MRPTKIVIEGFGTYLHKTEIDFTVFGNEGLYLITGDTGSGKTTIFDAITFALYGTGSGENRNESLLRTKGAADDVPTYVDFTFILKGKEYNIYRSPEYKVASKKTPNAKKVCLTLPSGQKIEKLTEVSNKVKEILGIDVDQFKKLAMIAQGDFQKLLTDESKVRQQLFTTLFKTEKYKKIEDKVMDDCKKLSSSLTQTKAVLDSQMNNVSCDETHSISVKLNEVKTSDISWEEKLKVINEIIAEDEKHEKDLSKDKKKLQEEKDKIMLKVEQIRNLEKDDNDLKAKTEEKNQKDILLKEQSETVQVWKEAFDSTPSMTSDKALIENELSNYDELDKKTTLLKEKKITIENLTKKLERSDSDIQLKKDAVAKIKSELESLKNVDVNHQKFLNEIEKNKDKIETLSLLKSKKEELNKLTSEKELLTKAYEKASEEADKLNEEFRNKNKAFLNGQAGILAQSLEEGKPCPVCGSIHHPIPCVKCDEVPSEDELNELKALLDKKDNDAQEKSKKCASINAAFDSKKEDFLSSANKLFSSPKEEEIDSLVETTYKETTILLEETRNKLLEEEEKSKRKETLEQKLPNEEKKVDELKDQKIKNENEKVKLSTEVTSLEEQIKEIKVSLKFASKKEAENKIHELEQKIDNITRRYNDANDNLDKTSKALASLQGTIKEISNRIESSSVKASDKEIILKKDAENKEQIEKLENDMKVITSRLSSNKKALESINKNIGGYVENEKRLTMLHDLDVTLRGLNKEKINLETYAQMAYFDLVLHYANQRLDIMSEHQYELVRRVDNDNHQKQTGLEIDVIDHFAGTRRDVKTLSGGETFQASLSLALGLSDEVSSSSGGIKIDTMFIDEGFGTLDHETMQKAYKALMLLAQANKLIGIISHVDYLKENVDKQIVVTKTRNSGSSVTIKV